MADSWVLKFKYYEIVYKEYILLRWLQIPHIHLFIKKKF